MPTGTPTEQAIFAAGCFWGVESTFLRLRGVESTCVGYCGGREANPTYQMVCTGTTGHAEAVQITFQPRVVSYAALLDVFWVCHDPTQRDRQGADIGTQYRSAIFFLNATQQQEALASKASVEEEKARLRGRIVTEITPAGPFYRAEEYHQRYFERHQRGGLFGFLRRG